MERDTREADVDRIIEIVARRYRVDAAELYGACRSEHLVAPRKMAMYLAREITGLSYPSLGRIFGRNHTTILYAYRTVVELGGGTDEDMHMLLDFERSIRDELGLVAA